MLKKKAKKLFKKVYRIYKKKKLPIKEEWELYTLYILIKIGLFETGNFWKRQVSWIQKLNKNS